MTRSIDHTPEQYSDADFVRVAEFYIGGAATSTGEVAKHMEENLVRMQESSPEQWQAFLDSTQTVHTED